MPLLAERRETSRRTEQRPMPDVATAMTARRTLLVEGLSGGMSSWYITQVPAALPATMVQPARFDDSDEDVLTALYLVRVDEDDDQW